MKATLSGCRIAAIVATPGPVVRRIDDEVDAYGGDRAQIDRIRRTLGLDERRVAPAGVTALDLCETAARAVLAGRDVREVDAVIFVTQTPDHSQPCNAAILHGRLALEKNAGAFDVNLGCSGYVYGLHLAWSLFQGSDVRSVLLCAGDTLSRVVNPRDRSTAPLFGDAGTATLLVRDESAPPAHFELHTDGAGRHHLCVSAGGARTPASPETKIETVDADGNFRCAENLAMNGAEVFNFTLREVPPLVSGIRALAGWEVADTDALVCHQANRFMVNHLARVAGFPPGKVPSEVCGRYGNQSCASIPFTLCHTLGGRLADAGAAPLKLVLCGFGVGLSWGAAAIQAGGLDRAEVVEYPSAP